MTEHDPDEQGPGFDAEQEEHVRALLGEVGGEHEPIPDEVSARLDDTLASLRAERVVADDAPEETSRGEAANVVPLRRRWLPRAAGAAAAVIVLGVGGLAAVRLGTDDPTSQDSAASGGAVSDTTLSEGPTDAPVPSAGSGVTPGAKSRALRESADAVRALPAITSTSFAGDVAALLRQDSRLVTPAERAAVQPDEQPGEQPGEDSGTSSEAPEAAQPSGPTLLTRQCPGPAVTDGAVTNPVRVDGALAVLLVHPVEDGTQLVEAWSCAGDRRLDSTRLSGTDVSP